MNVMPGNFFDKDLAKAMNLPTEYDAVRALSGKIHQIYVHEAQIVALTRLHWLLKRPR